MATGVPNAEGLMLEYDAYADTDSSAPWSPPDVVRIQYPGNDAGNGATGGWVYTGDSYAFKRMYMCIAVKFDSTYVTHTNGEKLWYPTGTNSMATPANIYIPVGGTATGTDIRVSVAPQSTIGTQQFYQTAGPYIQKGQWQMVEHYFVMNTPGVANGVWQAWINGTQVANESTVGYANLDSVWQAARWTGTRGGGASTVLTPPEGQRRFYDRVAVWGATS